MYAVLAILNAGLGQTGRNCKAAFVLDTILAYDFKHHVADHPFRVSPPAHIGWQQRRFSHWGRLVTSQHFQGRIDEVRVHNRALSATEVSTLPSGPSSGGFDLNWLVADQLGTPRMIFDKTGSLATTKRHDYLPFGEELFAGIGGRTPALGYTGDTTRQQFTLYERDIETGLDYANARYFAHIQGRFTSSDPMLSSGNPTEPQSWNRYAYVLNNPLVYADPSGLIWGYQDGTNVNGERIRTFVWFEGDQVDEDFEPYYSSHYVGRNEVLWLDSGSDQFLRIDRSNFSEEEYASLLSAQGTDCTAFSEQQRNIVNREIADEIGRSWQYGVMKGIASIAGGLAGGLGSTINFTFGATQDKLIGCHQCFSTIRMRRVQQL